MSDAVKSRADGIRGISIDADSVIISSADFDFLIARCDGLEAAEREVVLTRELHAAATQTTARMIEDNERLRAALIHAADLCEQAYGDLPSHSPPGPPTSLVAYMRQAENGTPGQTYSTLCRNGHINCDVCEQA